VNLRGGKYSQALTSGRPAILRLFNRGHISAIHGVERLCENQLEFVEADIPVNLARADLRTASDVSKPFAAIDAASSSMPSLPPVLRTLA
jgi:hypothetical protein